jgi:uncharacterized protein with ParB-like and HNH nuclease domain
MSNNNPKFSSDVIDETQKDDKVVPIQYDISSFGADYDVEGLVKRLDRDDIFIPPFQRAYVWTQKEASRFIESLLLGLPVPGIFLARKPETKKLFVIDGQQRLKTLQFFYNGYFNPKPNDKLKRIFRLINVQSQFENLTFNTLREKDKVLLNDSIIHATIVKQESPKNDDTSIYHIFERLNAYGRRLTPQQIRVAVFNGSLINRIKDLNEDPYWREIFGNESATLKDQELILRFIALYFDGENYKRPMNEFLNTFSQKNREPRDPLFLEEAEKLFKSTIEIIYKSIGLKAFRPERGINAAVYDSVMVGLARRIKLGKELEYEAVNNVYQDLISNDEYLKAISQSTSDDRNVEFRLNLVSDKFSQI